MNIDNIDNLDKILEALLFVSGDGLKTAEIAQILELQKTEIDRAVKRLKERFSGESGIHLISYNGKIQFGSNPAYTDSVAGILNPIRERALSNAALETVAIVAYRQPVTRLEIEKIRGVSSDYAVSVLLKNNLIEVVGRKDVIGKPLLFATTDDFLKRFRIESIEQLPDYEKLLESIKLINTEEREGNENTSSLYNEFVLPDEEATPEFLEGEQISMIE